MNTLLACAVLACVAIATALPTSKKDQLLNKREQLLIKRLLLAIDKKENVRRQEDDPKELQEGDCDQKDGIRMVQCKGYWTWCIQDVFQCDGKIDCSSPEDDPNYFDDSDEWC